MSLLPKVFKRTELNITLCNIPVPKGLLGRNFGIFGSMGGGKTVSILNLFDQFRAAGLKILAYDPYGEFVSYYYRDGVDDLLSPIDKRTKDWNICSEMRMITDPAMIATSFIPKKKSSGGNESEFSTAAKILIEDLFTIIRLKGGTLKDVRDIITQLPLPKLSKFLKREGVTSAGIMNEENPKTSLSVSFTLIVQEAIRFFTFFDNINADYSVRDFIAKETPGDLFLPGSVQIRDTCVPFIRAWLELAILEAMDERYRGSPPRLVIFLDELASLGMVGVMEKLLTEGRKYGIITVVGTQDIVLMYEIYGEYLSQVFVGNLQNKAIFRVEEPKSAQYLADALGKEELEEKSESISMGADSTRDGLSFSSKRIEYHVVGYSEIMTTSDNNGWVKVSGNNAVRDAEQLPHDRPILNETFIERDGLRFPKFDPSKSSKDFMDSVFGVPPTAPVDLAALPVGFDIKTDIPDKESALI